MLASDHCLCGVVRLLGLVCVVSLSSVAQSTCVVCVLHYRKHMCGVLQNATPSRTSISSTLGLFALCVCVLSCVLCVRV